MLLALFVGLMVTILTEDLGLALICAGGIGVLAVILKGHS